VLLNKLRRLAEPGALLTTIDHALDLRDLDREDTTLAEVEARIVEGTGTALHPYSVTRSNSQFTSFLDGIQRSEVKFYHGAIPIVYAYAAAATRARIDRRMQMHKAGLLREREACFFPFRLLDPVLLRESGLEQHELVDTSPPPAEPLPLFPPVLYRRAVGAINTWREWLEAEVARDWCRLEDPGWLLVDGTLTVTPELSTHPRAVGLIKSHRTRFFDGEDARVLLQLKAGQRTSVFEPLTRRWTPVHSWYLRLRDPSGHDLMWGLVRVEIAASADSPRMADQISGWLLGETTPLTLPSPHWDRLLYPLHECRQYLQARAPRGPSL
jgi:hypothetical protein